MLQSKENLVENSQNTKFNIGDNDNFYFRNRLCVLDDSVLKLDLLIKAHNSVYTIYLGNNKMYCDLKYLYWWSGMV